jgi:hypothetical protein
MDGWSRWHIGTSDANSMPVGRHSPIANRKEHEGNQHPRERRRELEANLAGFDALEGAGIEREVVPLSGITKEELVRKRGRVEAFSDQVDLSMFESSRDLHLRENSEANPSSTRPLSASISKSSFVTSAAIPARPSVPETETPYTFASSIPAAAETTSATSLVETFSPFHRNVSPIRSTK